MEEGVVFKLMKNEIREIMIKMKRKLVKKRERKCITIQRYG